MNKKSTLIYIILFSTILNAQKINFGIKAGLNVSMLTGTGAIMNSTYGYHLGGLVELKVLNKIALQPEVLFSTQGAKLENRYNPVIGSETVQTTVSKLNYINIPIMLKYYVIQDLYVEAGPQFGLLVSAKNNEDSTTTTGSIVNFSSSSNNVKDQFKSLDAAAAIGVGYDLLDIVFAQVRYSIGLSNLNNVESSQQNIKNGVFQLSVGYKF